jgi:hypothetical protein
MEATHHEVTLSNAQGSIERLQAHLDATFISIETYLAWLPDHEVTAIFAAVGHLPLLTTFRISFSFQRFRQLPVLPIPSQALVATLQSARQLQTLTLDEVRFAFRDNHDVEALATALRQAPNIASVTLFNCFPVQPILPAHQLALHQHHHHQQHLQEEPCRLSPDPIAYALSNMPSLLELNLIFTIEAPGWIGALLKQSCNSQSMQILRINVPDGSFLGDPIQFMCHSLQTNSTLKELSIRCPLDGDGGRALARALTSPQIALQELYIQMKSYHYAIPIADALRSNKRLKSFELRVWTGGDRRPLLEAYEAMVPHNTVIENLVIDNGRLGLTPVIDFYLEMNRAGRRGLLEEGDKWQKSEWINFMIRFRPDVSVLFYTLSLNPSLCSVNNDGATALSVVAMDEDNNTDYTMRDEKPSHKKPRLLAERPGSSSENMQKLRLD